MMGDAPPDVFVPPYLLRWIAEKSISHPDGWAMMALAPHPTVPHCEVVARWVTEREWAVWLSTGMVPC